jgi:CHAT domain-containing protein
LTLARALPQGARLHLATHSRGGLVAEVLARVCNDPMLRPKDFESFDGAAYAGQREDLTRLGELVRARDIRVDRVVRVGCPSRGTLLASKRLDAYVSVLKWTLELAGIPVAPEIVDFLGEVAQRRADPLLIPGLAAQIPNSPLVEWLHAVEAPIAGELRVISGDVEGDSVISWLKTLLADAFYWTDNDLVVHTRSMYGGAPRAAGATFLYDRGGKVTHFNYFSNKRTADAITRALVEARPVGFRTIGPLSWSGEESSGLRGEAQSAQDSSKPAVFVIPGILGSNLKVDGKRVWVSWRVINSLKQLEYAAGQQNVEPDGPIASVYDELIAHLGRTHEVIPFAFDWRVPIEQEGRRLGAAVSRALDARSQTGQPVRIVAHSMGGLVTRVMQLECPETWGRMMERAGARLLMLGVPNEGSWAPMQVLSGDDTFGNMLASAGSLLNDHAAREVMAGMPGFLQLQAALRDPERGLHLEATWQKLADEDLRLVEEYNFWHSDPMQLAPYRWGVPPQDVLAQAVALRDRLDEQRKSVLPAYSDRILLVVGKSSFTPDGYAMDPQGLYYLDAADGGDGRVTLASASLPGVRTWQLESAHGDLPAEQRAFAAYSELLEQGGTELLPEVQVAVSRGAGLVEVVRAPSRPSRLRSEGEPPERPGDVLSKPQHTAGAPSVGARSPGLQVSVVNGDLMFETRPLLLGHYTSRRLTGTERAMDRVIGGRMSEALSMGQYADAPRSHRVFVNGRANPENPWQPPRPEAVIVVGLGPEGKLRSSELQATVTNGVIAWSQRLVERRYDATTFELAATLIGSGGIGVSVGESAQAIVRGVHDANRLLAERDWPRLGHLYLVDLYLDRASEAWRALQIAAAGTPGFCTLSATIRSADGALERPLDSGYRGAGYDYISAVRTLAGNDEPVISYTLDTRRARSEVRGQVTQGALLRELLKNALSDDRNDPQIGRTLYKMLIPIELRSFFTGTTEIQIELDEATASIPWELLDSDSDDRLRDQRPWAIRAKLLRKLRTETFREQVTDATTDAGVLIVGEPACNPARYARLPNARAEAEAVSKQFAAALTTAGSVRTLISASAAQVGADATTIMNALFERPWRIVHIAGHGELPLNGNPRGVVLSNGTFLGPNEIRNLEVVPELVFVNCCHLAARDNKPLFQPSGEERMKFAAGVADQLIRIGVRCVVAAAWAVADSAANKFATTFYEALLRGQRFIDAVAMAREEARTSGGNTWAAYQCYGDPDWHFRRAGADAQRPASSPMDEFASVASASALVLALRTIEVRSSMQGRIGDDSASAAAASAPVRLLQDRFASIWGDVGEVAEAFGRAWAAVGDIDAAVSWYRRAVEAQDGSASLKAAEQLANLSSRAAARRAGSAEGRADQQALAAARAQIGSDIDTLQRLIALQPTMERESILAAAFKRQAVVAALANDAQKEAESLRCMQQHYAKAEAIGRDRGLRNVSYPMFNRLVAEVLLGAGAERLRDLIEKDCPALRQVLEKQKDEAPDFWSSVGMVDLDLLHAVAVRALASARSGIEKGYEDVHLRVGAPLKWESVYDTAALILHGYARQTENEAERLAANELSARLRGYCARD